MWFMVNKPFSISMMGISLMWLCWLWSGDLLASTANVLKASTLLLPASQVKQVGSTLAGLPLLFVPNQRQRDSAWSYRAHAERISAYFGKHELLLDITGRQGSSARVRLRPCAAEENLRLEPGRLQGTRMSYFRGRDATAWQTNLPTYDSLRYVGLYAGTDLVLRGQGQQLAYDFILAPGAAPERIRMAVEGVEKLTLDADGAMRMTLPGGDYLRQEPPFIYQEEGSERHRVSGGFVILASQPGEDGADIPVFGFRLAAYDPARVLIIDPVMSYATSPNLSAPPTLEYSTLIGGENDESVAEIVANADGTVIVVGTTASDVFPSAGSPMVINPATGGSVAAPDDGFIYKLDATGTALSFVTILAGDGNDEIHDVAVDDSGNIFVTGSTKSTDFATTSNALYPVLSGSKNAFLAKLDPSGTLLYSTYFGGTNSDSGNAIALDKEGNVFIAGQTNSSDLILRFPLYASLSGGNDGFIARFTTDGAALKYATYFGGSGVDSIDFLDVSETGDMFFAGNTSSSNLPIKHEIQKRGGSTDMFIGRIARGGGELVFSTYLGGSSNDLLTDMARDQRGNYLLSGYTSSVNFPVVNALVATKAGGVDGTLTKVDRSGRFLHFATYLGALKDDSAFAVAVDQAPDPDATTGLSYIYVGGETKSHALPVQNSLQNYHAGNGDGFLMKLDPCGQQLWFSSYFGGTEEDSINAMTTRPGHYGEIYFAGQTAEDSLLFPIEPALSTVSAGGIDIFNAHIQDIDNLRTTSEPELILGCSPESFAPERVCGTCGGATLPISLSDPNGVGISGFTTTVNFDPNELQFQGIYWNPMLPPSAHLQHDASEPGKLRLTIYQPIGSIGFAPLKDLIATLEFSVVDVGTIRDNPPLPSKEIRLTQDQLSAASLTALDTMITGLPGAVFVERRCNGLIGDCDCSGQVQIFEIQSGVDHYTVALPENQPFCVKRDYSVMKTTDLQEIINNYNNHVIDPAATFSTSVPAGEMRAAAFSPQAILATTSELNFQNPVWNARRGTWAYDLKLETNGQAIAVLATDIYYDPAQISSILVTPEAATQNANKQVAYAIVQPGWLRVTFYGINATTFPSDLVAKLVFQFASGVNCADLTNLHQDPSASTPFAEAVPIQGNSIQACDPIDDAPNRSSVAWQVSEIYVAVMGYAPDNEGLQYWVRQILNDPRWTRETVAQSFFEQPLVLARYAGMTDAAFVNTLYQNIFNRAPDPAGLSYWTRQLDAGMSRNMIILSMLDGGYANPAAEADMARFTHLVEVSLAFADRQDALGILYSQLSITEQVELRADGVEILKFITDDPFTRDVAITRIPTLLPALAD
jgi:hypothetical protein